MGGGHPACFAEGWRAAAAVVGMLFVLAGCGSGGDSPRSAAVKAQTETAPAATRPVTTAPVEDIPRDTVLIRIGNSDTITQGMFEDYAFTATPREYDRLIIQLVDERLWMLYLKDHPQLAPTEQVESAIRRLLKPGETLEQWDERIRREKPGLSLERARFLRSRDLARTALLTEGEKKGENEALRRQLYEQDPTAFNGTEVHVLAIEIPSPPYDTPELRQAKRRSLERIRERLVDGTMTWEQALRESQTHLLPGGDLGWTTRHGHAEPIGAAAFKLKVKEYSPVFENGWMLAFVQAAERREGNRPVDDPNTVKEMKGWMRFQPLYQATVEMRRAYPVVGVRPPARTPFMASKEGTRPQPLSPFAPPPAASQQAR